MSRSITVHSPDGTPLAVSIAGEGGAPIVLVHGACDSKESFEFLQALLAESNVVAAFDRRGHGASGDGADYGIESEAADIVAVCEALGSNLHLVGHSYGATCALVAAATKDLALASLTLYEPPSLVDVDPSTWAEAIRLIAAGELEAGFRAFAPIAGITEEEVSMATLVPEIWSRICNGLRRLERELDEVQTCSIFAGKVPLKVDAPALLIEGSLTDAAAYVSHDRLSRLLPGLKHVSLEGQRHLATVTAPEALAKAIRAHVDDAA